MRLTWPSTGVQWDNFQKVVDRGNLFSAFLNSTFYAIIGTGIAVFLGALAAFVLSRRKSRLTGAIYFYLVMGIVLPVNMAALMQVMKSLHLMNNQFGIVLLYAAINLPTALFIIHGFVGTIPRELDEAALIDGAHPMRLFTSIILPLLPPVLVTVALLVFTGIWNDFQYPLYVLGTTRYWPMTLAIYNFFGMYENDWNYIFADILLTCAPAFILFLLGQKQIISGLTSGAVKG
jgi:raffinose/stachyose/melibiose transport system permease protein